MTDRFDLEQKMMKIFDIVEDLKLVNNFIQDPRLEALAAVWEMKVEDIWNTFEESLKDESR